MSLENNYSSPLLTESTGAEAKTAILTGRKVFLTAYTLLLLVIYAPILREAWHTWTTDENYAHGVFILPCCAGLVWLQRDLIRKAAARPTAWGLIPLLLGFAMEIFGYALKVEFLAMVSLIPVLAGSVLMLHGKELWKITRFAVFFLFFAAPTPGVILKYPSSWIQHVSSDAAVFSMKTVGYPIVQKGNVIDLPQGTLEVAEACSGFKKLVALLACSLLYGYLFPIGVGKRLFLVLAAIPIAVFANVLRVMGLIAVTSYGGLSAMHIAHDWAEIVVLGLAMVMFAALGKGLGCRTPKYSL